MEISSLNHYLWTHLLSWTVDANLPSINPIRDTRFAGATFPQSTISTGCPALPNCKVR
jgi:hypothetical protein